jgi:ubiquinone/menaquinone biosynthesis C-methylase UbiE
MYGKYSELYDKWCNCYDVNENEIEIIDSHIPLNDAVILDIGCGTGRLSFKLAGVAKYVYGVDIDTESTKIFERKITEKKTSNIEVITGDIASVDFSDKSLDVVVFSWSFYSLPNDTIQTIISKILKWLKIHGKILILQPNSTGQFEDVMRSVFEENQDGDEYINCFKTIESMKYKNLRYLKEFEVRLNFEFSDLDFGVKAIKMFAVTEGAYKEDPTLIPSEPIIEQFKKYFNGEKYVLNDFVRGFIFEKTE